MKDGSLAGQFAVITGAASGIGRGIALKFAREGARVALLDIQEDALTAVAREVEEIGSLCLPLTVDLASADEIAVAFETIGNHFEAIDVLVNNVGQTAREKNAEFWNSDPSVWDFVIDVSLKSTLRCSRHVVPGMRERRRGKIVNISSDSVFAGDKLIADYVTAKAGVIGFTRSLARELAEHGVNVNAVAPGSIKTGAQARLSQEFLERSLASVPMGYRGEPEDIANAVWFLSTDLSRYITGQTVVVDGGRMMR